MAFVLVLLAALPAAAQVRVAAPASRAALGAPAAGLSARVELAKAEVHAAAGQPARAMESAARAELALHAASPEERPRIEERIAALRRSLFVPLGHIWTFDGDAALAGLPRGGPELAAWASERPLAGDPPPVSIRRQEANDCVVCSIWNHPRAGASARDGDYAALLAQAEGIQPLVAERGMQLVEQRSLLAERGWELDPYRRVVDEERFVEALRREGALFAAVARFAPGSRGVLERLRLVKPEQHALVIASAVRHDGRWWYVALDSSLAVPRLKSFGELLLGSALAAAARPVSAARDPR